MKFIRLLVVSHNSFGKINNMGKTLETSFCGWEPDKIAQLYFTDEIPKSDFCRRFFRITDFDVAKTLVGKKHCGGIISSDPSPKTDNPPKNNVKSTITQKARRRTPLVYLTRNLMWKLGRWKTKEFISWLDDFSPEAVFYAAGDYSFSYEVALDICRERNIPLYISCYDDFYLGGYNSKGIVGRHNYKKLMKKVDEAFSYSKDFFCICDSMTKAYSEFFGKQGYTLRMGASFSDEPSVPVNQREKTIIYAGNLDYGRAEQLVALGKALKNISHPDFKRLDVYSGEIRQELLDMMTEENGIYFHGRVSADRVKELLRSSMFALHVESFDKRYIPRVKYSVSTKIADTLASGACMVAFGPCDLASISYLSHNNSAFVVSDMGSLESELKRILTDLTLRETITRKGMELAKNNHDMTQNRQMLFEVINRGFESESASE